MAKIDDNNKVGPVNTSTQPSVTDTGEPAKNTKKPGGENNKVDPIDSGLGNIDVNYVGPVDTTVPGTTPPDPTTTTDFGMNTTPGSVGPGGNADPLLTPEYVTKPGLYDHGQTAPQREVQDNELASTNLTKLLASDSKYMRQARQEGLAYAGSMGGTQGIQAAYASAIKAGAPIAIADAQAYMDAASQNLDVLAQFGLANIQRATQLDLGVMDANTRIQTTAMQTTAQMNIAKMQDITNRDIANLDAATRVQVTEMNGVIQQRLAKQNFDYSVLLNDQTHGQRLVEQDALLAGQLERTALQGEYDLEGKALLIKAQDDQNYVAGYMGAYDSTLDRIANLNNIEMDNNARQRAEDAIWEGFYAQVSLLEALYPGAEPIVPPSGGG